MEYELRLLEEIAREPDTTSFPSQSISIHRRRILPICPRCSICSAGLSFKTRQINAASK